MDKKSFLEGLLGQKPTTKQQTVANIIGGALFTGGFLGAYGQKTKSFEEATKGVQSDISSLLHVSDARAEEAQKALTADLAGYKQAEIGKAQAGLAARGIGDRGVAKETATGLARGLSGAYAAARAALSQAKLQAGSRLSSTMSQYHQQVAQKQYQSLLQNYYAKMGIWGALGGLGSGLMAMPSPTKEEPKDKTIYNTNPKLNLGGI